MDKNTVQAIAALPVILLVGGLVALAGSTGSVRAFGWPLFAVCGAVSFVINWIAFVPSYARQTEHYFDLTGSVTYVTLVLLALFASGGGAEPRSILLATLVVVWAVRLGTFLSARVKKAGKDRRFNAIKQDFFRFLMAWTLQGLWVFLTLAAALAALTAEVSAPLGWIGMVGLVLWAIGFGIEVVADQQKQVFRADPSNDGDFISSGLWAWSRHPNYFGEIVLWLGIAVIAAPVLEGWQWVTMISPLFVYVLLTRISGVPMLERRAQRQWGDEPEYQEYVRATPVLFPRPPSVPA